MKVHCYYLLVRCPQIMSPKNLSIASLNSQKKKKKKELRYVQCFATIRNNLLKLTQSFLVPSCPLFYKVILVISAAWPISLKHRGADQQHLFFFCSWFSGWGILERQLDPLLVLFFMGLQHDVSWGFNHLKVSPGWMPKMAHTHGWQPMVAVDGRLSWVVDMSTYSWPR